MTKPIHRERLLALLAKYGRLRDSHQVLIVEDDADTRDVLKGTFEKDGWKVDVAENGLIALDQARKDYRVWSFSIGPSQSDDAGDGRIYFSRTIPPFPAGALHSGDCSYGKGHNH
jgi:hypothetical protein